MKEALEHVVVSMFCNASIVATDDQKQKLEKLLKLWESKTNYLKPETLEKMRNPIQSYQQFQSEQMAKYASEVASLAQQTKITFEGYQAQHQAFVCHAMQQIMDLQQQKQNLEQQVVQPSQLNQNVANSNNSNAIPLETIQASLQQTIQNLSQTLSNTAPSQNSQQYSISNSTNSNENYDQDNFVAMNTSIPPPILNQQSNVGQSNPQVFSPPPDMSHQPPPIPQSTNGIDTLQFSQPPPGYFPPPGMFPDFSKPPPGFLQKQDSMYEDLMPTAPYYDLPAGLMVPLVKVCIFL